MPAERLQKLIARSGVASRRAVEGLIADGRVTVNGRPAALGDRADPLTDRVEVDGRPLAADEARVHIAVHKPRGLVSSARDERGRRSVVSLVPGEATRLWPAGRLDVDSEGLMVLTNDGEWANRVLHPRYGTEREYAVLLEVAPERGDLARLLAGVQLDDGFARLLSARRLGPPPEIERVPHQHGAWLRVRLGEGRKREVRRLFAAIGLSVQRLVRTRLGPLGLNGLRAGEWRPMTGEEVAALVGERVAAGQAPVSVAIDGPSGSGKSTIGHAVAERIGATFVDTGLMYRALTLAALEAGIDVEDGIALGRLAQQVSIEVRRPTAAQSDRLETVLLDGRDVTAEVRTRRIDVAVSGVSRHAAVREEMLRAQRAMASRGDTVMVGRDIGTVVLPDATLKVYLTASAAVRAERRAVEMGRPAEVASYLEEIERRDAVDSGRSVAPLRQAADALLIDTGALDVDRCVESVVTHLPARASRS